MTATYPDLIRLGDKPRLVPYLRSIWSRRELALTIPMAELRAQNMDTVLGNLWHLLNPVMLVAIYYLLFSVILQVDRGTPNFVTFLAVGIFTFHYTQKSVTAGARMIVDNEGLIRSIAFPRAVLPIGAVIGETIALLPAIGVMLSVALVTGERPHVSWLLLVPLFALQGVFNLGGAMFAARLASDFNDVQNILPYLFRLLLYGSGVLIPVRRFITDPAALALFEFNPTYAFVTLARQPLLEQGTDPRLWAICGGWAVLLLLVGFTFFRANEHRYGRG